MLHNKLSTQKRNKIFACFCQDITATAVAKLAGVNRNTVNYYYNKIRRILLSESLQEGGVQTGDTDDPIPLILVINNTNWDNLFTALNTAEKYVTLDLSACTGTAFDTGATSFSNALPPLPDNTTTALSCFPNLSSLQSVYPSQGAGTYVRNGTAWSKQQEGKEDQCDEKLFFCYLSLCGRQEPNPVRYGTPTIPYNPRAEGGSCVQATGAVR